MLNYEVANKADVDAFINSAMVNCQSLIAIKGKAPHGAMYLDGDLITHPVNVGWVNESTSESIDIFYQIRKQSKENP